eukprot:2404284-Rhodomonas_salina.1
MLLPADRPGLKRANATAKTVVQIPLPAYALATPSPGFQGRGGGGWTGRKVRTPISLRECYGMSGTDIAYGAVQYPVLILRVVLCKGPVLIARIQC